MLIRSGVAHVWHAPARRRSRMRAALWAAIVMAALSVLTVHAQPPMTVSSSAGQIRVEKLAALEFPWAVAALPDGRLLITEKPGRLRIFANGQLSAPVEGVPATSYRERKQEQGGLLDVAVDPNFAQNRRDRKSVV